MMTDAVKPWGKVNSTSVGSWKYNGSFITNPDSSNIAETKRMVYFIKCE
jgi:hypothetical protein